jgi:hypothetical protein
MTASAHPDDAATPPHAPVPSGTGAAAAAVLPAASAAADPAAGPRAPGTPAPVLEGASDTEAAASDKAAAETGTTTTAQPAADAAPDTPAPRPVRRGESQADIEKGILRWMFVFFFATHLIGGVIWLVIYLSGHGGS